MQNAVETERDCMQSDAFEMKMQDRDGRRRVLLAQLARFVCYYVKSLPNIKMFVCLFLIIEIA